MKRKHELTFEYVTYSLNSLPTLNDAFLAGFESSKSEMLRRLDELTFLGGPDRRLLIDIIEELGEEAAHEVL